MINEIETKLNAPTADKLKNVGDHVLQDAYYQGTPGEDGSVDTSPMHLERTYYDTIWLEGSDKGAEIRIEHKSRRSNDSEKPYKMTVKVVKPGKANKKSLDRLEAAYRLDGPKPDLSVINDPEIVKALQKAFDVKSLRKVKLLPMVRIIAQRWKYTYHPNGDKSVKVEFDSAAGVGHDFTGRAFDLFQIELESKQGNPDKLEYEADRLMGKFNFLVVDKTSKPTPGFAHLKTVMVDNNVREYAKDHLDPKAFRVLNRIPGLKND